MVDVPNCSGGIKANSERLLWFGGEKFRLAMKGCVSNLSNIGVYEYSMYFFDYKELI